MGECGPVHVQFVYQLGVAIPGPSPMGMSSSVARLIGFLLPNSPALLVILCLDRRLGSVWPTDYGLQLNRTVNVSPLPSSASTTANSC